MNEMYLLERIGNIDEKYIEIANKTVQRNSHSVFNLKKRWYIPAIAACVVLLCLFLITRNYNVENKIVLEKSKGIQASFTDEAINIISSADLVELTEEQIFNDFNLIIIRGTVKNIRNIVIDTGSFTEYNALITIDISSVIKGDCKVGTEIDILIPCPINEDIWVEDTGVISGVRIGMEGIFMPVIYDESSYADYGDGHILYMTDIAAYGLMDGERFAFLEDGRKLSFFEWTFTNISSHFTLDDVERYIESRIR